MDRKGFLSIPAILVTLFVLLGALGFVSVKTGNPGFLKMQAPTSNVPEPVLPPAAPQASSTDETANWKTYRNDEYGFEFKYPSDYLFEITKDYKGSDWRFKLTSPTKEILIVSQEDNRFPELNTFEDFAVERSKAYCAADGPDGSIHCSDVNKESEFITANGIAGYEIYLNETTGYYMKNQETTRIKGPIFVLDFSPLDNPDARGIFLNREDTFSDREIIIQIISTFKFIADETANWKTYRNDEYGFEFKYPENILSLKQEGGGKIHLSHSVSWADYHPCDLRGVGRVDSVVDFSFDLEVVQKNLAKAVKEKNQYFTVNFTDGGLIKEEGTAKEFIAGSYKGYSLEVIVEGCGEFNYYLPLNQAATLFVKRPYIYYVASKEAISLAAQDELLKKILATFKFTDKKDPSVSCGADFQNWKTYRNDTFGFLAQYPSCWQLCSAETRATMLSAKEQKQGKTFIDCIEPSAAEAREQMEKTGSTFFVPFYLDNESTAKYHSLGFLWTGMVEEAKAFSQASGAFASVHGRALPDGTEVLELCIADAGTVCNLLLFHRGKVLFFPDFTNTFNELVGSEYASQVTNVLTTLRPF